jgi:alkaline phosphatase
MNCFRGSIRWWQKGVVSLALLWATDRGHAQERASLAKAPTTADFIASLQAAAIESKTAAWGHWGVRPQSYSAWTNHSNRLIPVYTFGGSFQPYMGEKSIYRDAAALEKLYGRSTESTFNPAANYADQTDIYRMQRAAIEAGKKYVVLVVFDGMDWQTTWAAAIYAQRGVGYTEGRGRGLVLQDYRNAESDFGYVVTSPHDDGLEGNPDLQQLTDEGVKLYGGYDARLGGDTPWAKPADIDYLIGRSKVTPHAYTDSSSSATSLTAGAKIFNGSVNVTHDLRQVETLAHWVQREKQMSAGAVTSVPISHATPAAAYAHNVSRDDFQDLTRDLLGLPSIAHPDQPLPGLDVLIGCGWGEETESSKGQGENFVAGNRYLADADLESIRSRPQGSYEVAMRTEGRPGSEVLEEATVRAVAQGQRLFGFFGVKGGHLPFRTADGDYQPVADVKEAEVYQAADLIENPTLSEMTRAALRVLERDPEGFWLMVEAGDVDWANHANNIDNSIGAVLSGDRAVAEVFRWVERNQAWEDTLVIVTADHGHYLNLRKPEVLAGQQP